MSFLKSSATLALCMWFIPALLVPATAMTSPLRSVQTHDAESCDVTLNQAYNGTLTVADEEFGASESPAFQAPLPGISRIWRGLGLEKRQTVCSTVCRTTNNGCCSGCTSGDGSIACGTTCCVNGYFCNASTQCAALTTTINIQSTLFSTSTYVSSLVVSVLDVSTITRTESSVVTVTITSANTATEVVTVTISNAAAVRARALVTPTSSLIAVQKKAPQIAAAPAITSIPSSTVEMTELVAPCTGKPQQNEADGAGPGLHKRATSQFTRTVVTGTTTSLYVITSLTTSTYHITSISATTTTVVSTSTTVLRAGTTVRSTTTTNLAGAKGAGGSTPTPSPAPSGGTGDDNKGLSTGAKAGIGAGIGIAAIAALFLAACFWRRRRQRSAHPGTDQPVFTPSDTHPQPGAATYYGNDKMRDSTVPSTAYSPVGQFSPSQSPGPFVHEAPTSEHGRASPYMQGASPAERGHVKPYMYEAPTSHGHEAYRSPPTQELYGSMPPQEVYGGMPPQEMAHGSPRMGYSTPHNGGFAQR